MLAVLSEIYIPLLSLLFFVLGTGFFSTLLAIKMTMANEPLLIIGSLTGVMYAGLVIASFRVEKFIIRVGHIRAYAVFSSIIAVICLLHGLYYNAWFWLFLRFLTGLAMAGIFVVIESWLMCKSTRINRGQVLSFYLIIFYLAQSFGQFFLYFNDKEMILFAVASMLCSISIIPLSMSSVRSPEIEEPSTLSWRLLFNKSTCGAVGSVASGLILGAIYGLMPTYFSDLFSHHQDVVANYMFIVIFGGISLQYPLGKLSDVIERRLVLLMVSLTTILVSALLLFLHSDSWLMFLLIGFFGGLTFTLHPISISHAIDTLDPKDIVAGSQSLLLLYSVGAMLGPLIAPVFMRVFGGSGLFIFFIVVCSLSVPIFILRKVQKADTPQEAPFLSVTSTSPIIAEIDPRGEG